MLFPDLVDIPTEIFGGYCPAVAPSDLAPGAAAIAQDVIFPMAGLRTRGGLLNVFGLGAIIPSGGTASVNGLKTFITPSLEQRLLAWDAAGNFYKESPQGTMNLVASRPYTNLFYQSQTLFGREYQAFFDADGGFDIPRQFDDTYWDRVSQGGPGVAPSIADSGTAGNIAAGLHQVTVAFITRQGFITRPAPNPTSWTAAGSKQAALTNIATGPPNIVGRLLMFTPVITAPAVTGSFYSLPTGTTQLATPTIMLINDNVTTAATVDFTDAILISGFACNYLFTQLELGEPSFMIGYNSRLFWLGERNKLQNLVNMDFNGGFGVAGSSPGSTSVGPSAPSLAVDSGTPGVAAWTNPNNVTSGATATCVIPSLQISNFLIATGYGFAIPANATIAGIVVTAHVKGSTSYTLGDNSVRLVKNGVIGGSDLANGNALTNAFANQSYGSSGNLWGLSLTPADVNAANFGVAYQAQCFDEVLGRTISINALTITVYYSTPVAGATVGPWGWTQGANYAGGSSALTSGFTADWGEAYAISGDGVTAMRGEINQSAYQDYLKVPIISRNTSYRVRARVASASGLAQGTLHVNLQSTTGSFTTSGLAIQAMQLTADYQEFDGLLTTAIIAPPADLLVQVYADGVPTNGGVFLIDSLEIYPTTAPFNYSTARCSHAFNPESYDGTTGQIQVRPNDGQQLRAGFPLRNNLYLAKDHYLCYVTDDGINEPAAWAVNEVSSTVGICGPNAVDYTEEWAVFAERSGLYLCWGADPVKITPEIQQDASGSGKITWQSINWQYGYTIWVRIDKVNKMILVGAPVNGATTPNIVFMLDYRWLDTAQEISDAPMMTYSSFSGKALAHGKGRRWALWTITANAMTFAERVDGTAEPFFGNGVGNGKIYQQKDCALQGSDDGVAIPYTYQGYMTPSHLEEQALQLGAHRKLFGYFKFRALGSGPLNWAITTAQRATLLRAYTLSINPVGDGERPLNLHGERAAVTIRTNTTVGGWFQLEKQILCVKKDPTIVTRGMAS